jgi:hypothetical protein
MVKQGFDYVRTVGKIAIEWNYLEVLYFEVIGTYIDLPEDTTRAILNGMGANQRIELLDFLTSKCEYDAGVRAHFAHFAQFTTIIGENRNTLQHGLPSTPPGTKYRGLVYKRNKQGKPIPYKASPEDLRQILTDIATAKAYAYEILRLSGIRISQEKMIGRRSSGARGRDYSELFARLEKPPLPHRIIPLPPAADPKAIW